MEILVLWAGTSIASFCLELANELRMFKDAFDVGYKVDVQRLSELEIQMNSYEIKTTFLSMLIPIFNVIQVFQKTLEYNNVRPMILNQLSEIAVLEEMTEEEKKEYLKNPTALNALKVALKSKKRLEKAELIKFNDGDEDGEIYYKYEKSLENITILKVSGAASKLTVEEQKKKVIETWKDFIQLAGEKYLEKYGNREVIVEALRNMIGMELNANNEKTDDKNFIKASQEISISDQKQALANLKNEISELLKAQETIQFCEIDNKQILSKRDR